MTAASRFAREPVREILEDAALLACDLSERRVGLVDAPGCALLSLEAHDARLAACIDLLGRSGGSSDPELVARAVAQERGGLFVQTLFAFESRQFQRAEAVLDTVAERELGELGQLLWWVGDEVLAEIAVARADVEFTAGMRLYDRLGQVWLWRKRRELMPIGGGARSNRRIPPPWAGTTGEVGWLAPLRESVSRESGGAKVRDALHCVLLGDRARALDVLEEAITTSSVWDRRELACFLFAASSDRARATFESLAVAPGARNRVECMAAFLGDPRFVPWLVGRMSDVKVARLAGESFTMITGVDLARAGLERKPPEGFESGPNDDPEDDDVAMDPDEGLPWPDPQKVAAWWKENEARFPASQRFFMGAPPSMGHCLRVLKSGYQRQRIAAAIWRCILEPGTPLFPTDAPAWRQRRWLAQMEA